MINGPFTIPLPNSYRDDIEKASRILREAGCTAVYLFGSLATGDGNDGSDIDLAVRGCRPEIFLEVYGKLLEELDHAFDLVDLDTQPRLAEHLAREGELLPIGQTS